MAAKAKSKASSRAHYATAANGSCVVVRLSRTQIVDALEKGARDRIGLTARTMLRRYREGRLADPSRITDLIALSNLLRKNDPILAG